MCTYVRTSVSIAVHVLVNKAKLHMYVCMYCMYVFTYVVLLVFALPYAHIMLVPLTHTLNPAGKLHFSTVSALLRNLSTILL